MARGRLKVFGWTSNRRECPLAANGNHQTREICAALSSAELMRITGKTRANLWRLCVTGNEFECELAMSKPGVVFWRPNHGRDADFHEAAPAK